MHCISNEFKVILWYLFWCQSKVPRPKSNEMIAFFKIFDTQNAKITKKMRSQLALDSTTTSNQLRFNPLLMRSWSQPSIENKKHRFNSTSKKMQLLITVLKHYHQPKTCQSGFRGPPTKNQYVFAKNFALY